MGVMPQFVHLCKIISSNLATDATKSRIFVTSGRMILQTESSSALSCMMFLLGLVAASPRNP